jgi:hypothetical protein
MAGVLSCYFCVSILLMKLSKVLLLFALISLGGYMLLTWLGYDDRVATYAITHEKEYRTSAEQGNAEAQYNLAMLYDRGLGVERDDAEALKWYRKAAEQGYAKAQYNLGMMYYFGKGVPQDKEIGYQWVILASDQGMKAAKDATTELAKQLSNEQMTNAKAAAKAWSQAHKK